MKFNLNKQEQERLSNKSVFFTACILLYAFLLLFIQKMRSNMATFEGAMGLIQIIRWISLVGAMACAAWSAYKERRGFLLYCGMCFYVFLSTLTLQSIHPTVAFPLNYLLLGAAFVLGQAFYYLKVAGLLEKGRKTRLLYIAACIAVALGYLAVCWYFDALKF